MAPYRSDRRERMIRWVAVLLIVMLLATVIAGTLAAVLS